MYVIFNLTNKASKKGFFQYFWSSFTIYIFDLCHNYSTRAQGETTNIFLDTFSR